jgi:Putative zinc-finger
VAEKDIDLKAALREFAAGEPGEAGPHIGLKRLIAYRQGGLPAAERETVQEHLSLCPRCTGLLRELRDFESASARGEAGPEPLRQEAWGSLARRLPAKAPGVLPLAGVARHEAPRSQRFSSFLVAAAAALLLVGAGLSVWAVITAQQSRQRLVRLEERLKQREEAVAALERQLVAAQGQIQTLEKERNTGREDDALAARVAELSSAVEELRRSRRAPEGRDRLAAASQDIELSVAPRFVLRGSSPGGFLRGDGAVSSVRIPPQGDRLTVSLSLADHPVFEEYRLELVDRDGKVLWSGHRPGKALLGDAGTSVSMKGLSPGLYRLRIEGLSPDRSELLAEYLFEIER